jgi:hypothetical protein
MYLEVLFLLFLVVALCAFAYRGAVHEFQILQKDYDEEQSWSELLAEELPLVIRGIPKAWTGAWSEKATGKKTWQVQVKQDGRRFKTTWAQWLATPDPKPQPENGAEIAHVARLGYNFSNMTADGLRRWSWLPPATPSPTVFGPKDYQGVQKLTAEFTIVVATDGAPLDLWIAHEGAIPANVSEDLVGKDPWAQTTEDIPWIGEVKYVEMRLRPGNAVLVPKHWWLAIRHGDKTGSAWFWKGDYHTPISWIASKLRPGQK